MKIRGLCRDFGFDIIKEKGVCHEAVDGMDDLGVCGNELGFFGLGLSVADGDGGALRGGHLLGGGFYLVCEVWAACQRADALGLCGGLLGVVRGFGWMRRLVYMEYSKRLSLSAQPFLLGEADLVVGQVDGDLGLVFERAVEELFGDFVLHLIDDGAFERTGAVDGVVADFC